MSQDNLKSKTADGIKWSLAGSYGAQILAFGTSIVLARLLSPEDFGIVGMAMTLVAILRILVTLGMNEALVQNKEISNLTASSVFFFNLSMGLVVGSLIALSAPLVANFYKVPELVLLVRLSAIIYVLSSMNVVQNALLNRSMEFKKLTMRNLLAQVGSSAVAIIMAFQGFGYKALMAQYLLSSLLGTLLVWRASSWKPSLEFQWSEIKRLWSYAYYAFLGSSLFKIFNELNTVFIAKVFSPATLGFYSRASSFSNLIVQNSSTAFRSVIFPVLSKMQDQPERFKQTYIRTYLSVLAVSVFLTTTALISANVLIISLFGEKWKESVYIFQYLMIQGISIPLGAISTTAILAAGKAKENFNFGHIRRGLVVLTWVSLLWADLKLFLTFSVISQLLGMLLSTYINWRVLGIELMKLLKPLATLALTSAFIWWGSSQWLNLENERLQTFVTLLIYTALYLAMLRIAVPEVANEGLKLLKTQVQKRLRPGKTRA